jgi:hypothetical protein
LSCAGCAFGCATTQTTGSSLVPAKAIGATDREPATPATPVASEETSAAKKAAETAALRAKLADHRKLQIARLHDYSAAGIFPLNLTTAPELHMLKDAQGTYCAVANLVVLDGLRDVIDATSKTHNDLLFADVNDGQLYSWILTSGLTREEIAAIQFPSSPVIEIGDVGAPTPVPPQVVPSKQTESIAKLRKHFAEMEVLLTTSTDASLDVAATRLEETIGPVALSLL